MIERTQRRLRQARFFHQHLVDQQAKGDPETFRFYFSAFILSARTVTWTLGNEEPDKWKAWKRKWKLNQEEDKLLKITRKLRNAEEKQGGADLTMELEEIAVEALLDAIPPRQRRGVNAAYIRNLRRQSHGASVKLMQPVHYYKDGKQGITTLCRRYLEVLENVVKDFSEQT